MRRAVLGKALKKPSAKLQREWKKKLKDSGFNDAENNEFFLRSVGYYITDTPFDFPKRIHMIDNIINTPECLLVLSEEEFLYLDKLRFDGVNKSVCDSLGWPQHKGQNILSKLRPFFRQMERIWYKFDEDRYWLE